MGHFEGISDRWQWFSKKSITVDEGAPFWLNELLSDNCYEKIMQLHHFTNEEPPPYEDKSLKCSKCRSGGTTTMLPNTHQAITIV